MTCFLLLSKNTQFQFTPFQICAVSTDSFTLSLW